MACYLFAGSIRSSENALCRDNIRSNPEEPVMDTRIDIEERQWFHRLQLVGRDQHAAAVKRMTRAELRRYGVYLQELQRISREEYRAMFGSALPTSASAGA
jgi:hypothetical protein